MTQGGTLELLDLESMLTDELRCQAQHMWVDSKGSTPMNRPCTVKAEWLYLTCSDRLIVCQGFKDEADEKEQIRSICLHCHQYIEDCERFVKL